MIRLLPFIALFAACAQAPARTDAPSGPTVAAAPAPAPAQAPAPAPPAAPVKTDPLITNTLVEVFENEDYYKISPITNKTPALDEVLRLGSPIGYELRTRYLHVGLPLAEALSLNPDPVFREKLIDMARWDRNAEARASALIALSRFQDPAHFDILREALVHLNAAVRFGAFEALLRWGYPEKTLPLLKAASERDPEPILRVYAAAGVVRLGDPAGLARLRAFLDNPSWVVRAMAALYLGEYGTAEDYHLLVSRIGREQNNDFVLAEYCIAALKLFGKKREKE